MVASSIGNAQTLFDFTRNSLDNVSPVVNWTENSDTMKGSTGMSKASIVMQKGQTFQRAILFTLLNPKKTGTGYAAVQCGTNFNVSEFNNIGLRCRAQGINVDYKMILRHQGHENNNSLVFGQVFTAPVEEFATVKLPFSSFKPYYRGQELTLEEHPLDLTAITNVGIKIDKGPYLPNNQTGVAALEIDWIKAFK